MKESKCHSFTYHVDLSEDNSDKEYITIYHKKGHNSVGIHMGYSETELTSKQVDMFITALKNAKKAMMKDGGI